MSTGAPAHAARADPSDHSAKGSVLLGRDAELTLVRSFLGRAVNRGGLLALSGNPGVGKSAIVDIASAMASDLGATVVRVVGTRTELDVSLSGIHQLLLGLRDDLSVLGTPHREALAVILEHAVANPGLEPPSLPLALLELLRRLSTHRPVLLAVDDSQWIDRPSTNILRFLAHRVRSGPVGFICASRTGGGSGLTGDWPLIEIAPLDEESSAGLLNMHFPALQPSVRRRVLAAARGNPLALIELSKALSNSHSDGGPYLGWPLPLTPRLRASVTPDLAHLTPDARRILLLAALEPSGDLQVLREAAAEAGGLGCLDPAEREGLIHFDSTGARLRFRDPLTRAAVIDMGTQEERRRAHAQLAGLLRDQPDRRARHLAEAALAPQEELAEFLEASARRMLGSGLISTGIDTLLRAARLSEGRSARGGRLAEAAYIGANVAGDWRIASELLADAQRSDPNLTGSIEAAVALSCLRLNSDGDLDSAARQLLAAIEGQPG